MLTLTEAASKKILDLMAADDQNGVALRVAVQGRGPGGFRYELKFVGEDEKRPEDTVFESGGVQVVVGPESEGNLKGSTIDFIDGIYESGFKIDNPNPLWDDPKAQKVQDVIDSQINPGVGMHGGHVSLLDVKDDIAYIALGGGCQGCGMVDVTLKQGIETAIKEAVPEIHQIIDSTDHAAGQNPFYQPSKGGQSPFA